MGIDRSDIISVLNNLIETCRDGQEGFRHAAEHVKDSHLKQTFVEFSTQRAQFVGQLQNEVQRLGEPEPQNTGSLAASAHRGWMDVKTALTKKDDQAILNECERGEDSAVETYRTALEKSLPANIREIVETQYSQVKQAHDRVRDLRNSLSPA